MEIQLPIQRTETKTVCAICNNFVYDPERAKIESDANAYAAKFLFGALGIALVSLLLL